MTCDDGFFADDDMPYRPEDVFRLSNDFKRTDPILMLFNVECDLTTLQLANALLNWTGGVREAHNVLRAADALRDVLGLLGVPQTDESRQWNDQYETGQAVRVMSQDSESGEFLSRTTSPAIDTAGGAVVLVRDHDAAVPLCDVVPVNIKCREL